MSRISYISFAIILVLLSCNHQSERTIDIAFYFWRSVFNLTPEEQKFLNHSQANKLYLKYFDIDWHGLKEEPTVVAPIKFMDKIPENIPIIPTIFITNRTLLNINEQYIENLAEVIIKKTIDISQNENLRFNEIQIDCDWSPKSRKKYFMLLELLKSNFGVKSKLISVTLRLHQYKYPTITGVPPVDKCMLMLYNVGDINNIETNNSILDIKTVKKYLTDKNYPLDIDIALPIFSWGVLYRLDEVVGLINNLSSEDLKNKIRFKHINGNYFSIIQNHYLNGVYVYNGDIIRIEEIQHSKLLELSKLISHHIPNNKITIAFFSLTKNNLKGFNHEKINEIVSIFK